MVDFQPPIDHAGAVFERFILERTRNALADTPVVFVQGARQSGKSTFVRQLVGSRRRSHYVTFDDPSTLNAARGDPTGFLAGLTGDVTIDEVQACPEIFPALKLAVDNDRRAGRFLLTGSANALVVPEMSRALVGRVELITMRALSQGELEGRREDFIDWAFGDDPPKGQFERPTSLAARVTTGGFPEAVSRRTHDRRAAWFEAYSTTIVQRDVLDLARVEGLRQLPDLIRLCAARSGGVLNFTEFSRALGLPQTTLKRYFALIEAVFLVQRVPAWSTNLGKRLVRSPKLFMLDTGLGCHLQGVTADAWSEPSTRRGALLENFVFSELDKQLGWSRTHAKLYHYRSHAGDEVDFLLEDSRGRVVAIEVKASATVSTSDVASMRKLAGELGERFVRGVTLYVGSQSVPFAANIHALPVSALWSAGTT